MCVAVRGCIVILSLFFKQLYAVIFQEAPHGVCVFWGSKWNVKSILLPSFASATQFLGQVSTGKYRQSAFQL